MLTRRAKAYSTFCLQTVNLPSAISSQFILGVCAEAEDRKINKNLLFWNRCWYGGKACHWCLFVIGSIPLPICNRFHERQANNGKITTFASVLLFDALARAQVSLNLENRNLDYQNLRSMLKISYAASTHLSQLMLV